jgi:hypothetical protein
MPDRTGRWTVAACADNAAMESFFSLLQKNVLNRKRWDTREELHLAIVTWIERTYHRRRVEFGSAQGLVDTSGQAAVAVWVVLWWIISYSTACEASTTARTNAAIGTRPVCRGATSGDDDNDLGRAAYPRGSAPPWSAPKRAS